MTVFVADSADARLADAVDWLSRAAAGGDELILVESEAEPHSLDLNGDVAVTAFDEPPAWLPGADLGVCGTPTDRLLELAAASGFDVHSCGPPTNSLGHPIPASPSELIAALLGAGCELSAAALRELFKLGRNSDGRIVAFDATGFVAAAVAAGASAAGHDRPLVISAGYPAARHVRVSGVRESIEARLASVDLLGAVELRSGSVTAIECIVRDAPISLLVLPRGADYVDVHAAATALGPASTIVRTLELATEPGADLALQELSAAGRVPSLARVIGDIEVWRVSQDGPASVPEHRPREAREPQDGGAAARKLARETVETKHFLSGRHIENFVEHHGPSLTGRILDFGCGNKPYAETLRNATTLVGVDVEQSSERCVDVLIDPGEPLPFATGWFDGAICTEVIEHVEEPWTLLKEIGRVLQPGGRIILTTPFVWPLHEEPRDFMRFSPHALAYLLERAGFEVEVVERAGGLSSVINQLQAERLHGGDAAGSARIRELNEQGVERDLEDTVGTISTHFPVLARRR